MPYVEQHNTSKQAINSGAAVTSNIGIQKAKGRFITLLDANDQWAPTKLAEQVGAMRANYWPFFYTAYTK